MKNKSMVLFLVSLLLAQTIFQGCTVMGYVAGRKREIRQAKKVETDVSRIKVDDLVEIKLADNTRIRGWIIFINKDTDVRIRYIGANYSDDDFVHIDTFIWEEIKEISFIEIDSSESLKGAVSGIVFDFVVPVGFLLMLTILSVGAIGA